MFTEAQKQILIDAMNMLMQSNKRMQQSKPQFKAVFDKLDTEYTEVLHLVKAYKTK